MSLRTRYSEEDLERLVANVNRGKAGVAQLVEQRFRKPQIARSIRAASSKKYKSKLEEQFAGELTLRKLGKVIVDWWYEPLNLRLPGKKNFYKPDFLVLGSDRSLTFYDTKGRNKSDARSLVKIKTAAGITPWATFIQIKFIEGYWEERLIEP